jgi:hypothetical protein
MGQLKSKEFGISLANIPKVTPDDYEVCVQRVQNCTGAQAPQEEITRTELMALVHRPTVFASFPERALASSPI